LSLPLLLSLPHCPPPQHDVRTPDGWLLPLQRLPARRPSAGGAGRHGKTPAKVCLFLHGVLDSSVGWVAGGAASPAAAAHDRGWDVWCLNTRACPPFRRARGYDRRASARASAGRGRDPGPWRYSVNHLAAIDLDVLIERVHCVLTAEAGDAAAFSRGARVWSERVGATLERAEERRRRGLGRGVPQPSPPPGTPRGAGAGPGACAVAEAAAAAPSPLPAPRPYRLVLVAHSLGGAAALMWLTASAAAGRPRRVDRLVLLSPAGFHARSLGPPVNAPPPPPGAGNQRRRSVLPSLVPPLGGGGAAAEAVLWAARAWAWWQGRAERAAEAEAETVARVGRRWTWAGRMAGGPPPATGPAPPQPHAPPSPSPSPPPAASASTVAVDPAALPLWPPPRGPHPGAPPGAPGWGYPRGGREPTGRLAPLPTQAARRVVAKLAVDARRRGAAAAGAGGGGRGGRDRAPRGDPLGSFLQTAFRTLLNGDASDWTSSLLLPHWWDGSGWGTEGWLGGSKDGARPRSVEAPGASLGTALHLGQWRRDGRFRWYDYGPEGNAAVYGPWGGELGRPGPGGASAGAAADGPGDPPDVASAYWRLAPPPEVGTSGEREPRWTDDARRTGRLPTPVDLVAGTRDGVVPLAAVRAHAAALLSAGAVVGYAEFPLGHLDLAFGLRGRALGHVLARMELGVR